MSLAAGSQKSLRMVGLGMANLMYGHQMQNGQLSAGRNGTTMLKQGSHVKGVGPRLSGSEQQTAGAVTGAANGHAIGSKLGTEDWPSRSFPFDQAQEEQLTTIHRLLHSAINNVDPNAAGIVLDGTFFPFSAKCTPFQPGRGFLLPPEVEVRWDDSLPFPQKPVEQRVLVYYPAEKRVRWEAQTNGRKQVEGTALLVESRTYTLQLEKELCIKYEMRLSQDVLNFMQAKSSPTLISHAVRPFRMRASTFQSPEVALSVSSAGALHPDSTWQSRSGSSDGRPSRLSGTPPMEPSNAKAISNLFLFHRKLHFPERAPPDPPLQSARFAKQPVRDVKPPHLNGVTLPAPGLDTKPAIGAAMLARGRTPTHPLNQTLPRLQNGSATVPQAQVILQPGLNTSRTDGAPDANGARPGSGGLGRPPSSHSQRTGSESGQMAKGLNGLAGLRFSASQELNSWAPALAKMAEGARMGMPEKPRSGPSQQNLPAPATGRVPALGYTMDKISRLSAQQQSLLLQQAQLLHQQRQMQQQPPKPAPGLSPGLSSMIPTPGYVPPQPQPQQQQQPAPPVSQAEPVKKPAKGKSRGKKGAPGKQGASSGSRQLSPASSAANSSAGSPPLSPPSTSRNPSPMTLPSSTYDQNIPIAQLLKANRKKHKSENASGASSPTASRDSLKPAQRSLQRTASSMSGGSFLSGLSNPVPNHGSPSVTEAASPRGREGGTMIPTPGLSLLGPNRAPSGGALPFLPTDATSTGSLLESPRFSNALTGRGQNGSFAAAARSSDSLQGLGGMNQAGAHLGPDPAMGGMQMIPTPGMMPTPGMAVGTRSWEPSADLLSDLQSSGTNGGEQMLEQWPQQPGSFMDMLTDDAGGAAPRGGAAAAAGAAADASADPFKEVLDSLDLDLFQEEGALMQSEPGGGVPEMEQGGQSAAGGVANYKDSRAGMELEVQAGAQPMGSGSLWQAHAPVPAFAGAQSGFETGYAGTSAGLDHQVKELPMEGDGGMMPSYMQLPLDQGVQQAHANTSYVSWDPGTSQDAPGSERTSAFGQGGGNAAPSQGQVDAMGLDANGDPGLSGALDELMELDADFLDINLDDGTLFDGGIGEGDWSIGGF